MTTIKAAQPQILRPVLTQASPKPAAATKAGAGLGQDTFVASKPPAAPVATPATFKELSAAKRERLAAIEKIKASTDPAAKSALQQETAAYMDWLQTLEGHPAFPMGKNEVLKFWMDGAAQLYLEARPLPVKEARIARFQKLFGEFHAQPSLRTKAMLKAAASDVLPKAPLPLSSTSAEIEAQLAPAITALAVSKSPLAQELAKKICSGEISLKMVTGKAMGTQFYAVVNSSKINLSNGQEGPNFFELSPPFQAAILLHEYTHVKQKASASGMLAGIGGNLVQRSLGIASRLAGSNAERVDAKGRGMNGNEQEAYRNEKAFLTEMGMGKEGLNVADVGLLVGVDDWLAAAK